MTKDDEFLKRVLAFIDEVLCAQIEIDESTLKNDWNRVVLLHLWRSWSGLQAVSIVSGNALYDPAVVLTRHLFELAVNIRYLDADSEVRVPLYLEHCGARLSPDEQDKIVRRARTLWEQGDFNAVSELLIPKGSWKPLKEMCIEIGCLNHYLTMYRLASESTHGGAHELALTTLELTGRQKRPDWQFPAVLLAAVIYFKWVAEISRKVLPSLESSFQFDSIWGETIRDLEEQVRKQVRK